MQARPTLKLGYRFHGVEKSARSRHGLLVTRAPVPRFKRFELFPERTFFGEFSGETHHLRGDFFPHPPPKLQFRSNTSVTTRLQHVNAILSHKTSKRQIA